MHHRTPVGIASFVIGLISIAVTLTATYGEKFRGTASAYLLSFLDRMGLIAAPSSQGEMEMKTPSVLSLTDETALIGLLSYGIYLAAVAMILAIRAEAKRENSMYLGAGFIFGAIALVVASFMYGMAAMVFGAVTLLLVRGARRA